MLIRYKGKLFKEVGGAKRRFADSKRVARRRFVDTNVFEWDKSLEEVAELCKKELSEYCKAMVNALYPDESVIAETLQEIIRNNSNETNTVSGFLDKHLNGGNLVDWLAITGPHEEIDYYIGR